MRGRDHLFFGFLLPKSIWPIFLVTSPNSYSSFPVNAFTALFVRLRAREVNDQRAPPRLTAGRARVAGRARALSKLVVVLAGDISHELGGQVAEFVLLLARVLDNPRHTAALDLLRPGAPSAGGACPGGTPAHHAGGELTFEMSPNSYVDSPVNSATRFEMRDETSRVRSPGTYSSLPQ